MSIRLERIIPPDGYGGKTITTAAQFGYDRHGLEGYLGNVGCLTASAEEKIDVAKLAERARKSILLMECWQ